VPVKFRRGEWFIMDSERKEFLQGIFIVIVFFVLLNLSVTIIEGFIK
jgi:hypothetical protein